VLVAVRKRGAPAGREAALFLFLYAFLRIFVDLVREYPQTLIGLPAGQAFNVFFTVIGAAFLVRNYLRKGELPAGARLAPPSQASTLALGWRRFAFALILSLPLSIPSDGIRDVPTTYGHRHPGIQYSSLYIPLR
jgi:hypothetical protein